MMHPGLGQPLPHAQRCIYMDYNATTPVFPQVAHAMLPFVTEHFGNPSSIHTYGRTCKAGVDKARSQLSRLVGSKPSEVFFTACGTESDNWAVYGTVMAARSRWGVGSGRVPHVVCSKIEHPAVLVYLQHLKDQGLLAFTEVPCDDEGLISPDDVVAALTPDTVLVTIMHSNNEVGSVQPIAAITTAVHAAAAPGTVLIHTDAAQSMGKVQVLVDEMGVDMCTIVGHKFGAPKGVAALYIKDGVQLNSYLHGGGQEAGRRAGTENIILVVGMGEAAEIAAQEAADTAAHMTSMRERLLNGLLKGLPPDVVRVNGPKDGSCRLPNTLSISIRGLNASQALLQLQDQLAASAGAACHSSGHSSISSVLKAMGVDPEFAMGTLRLSTGRHTTPEEVDTAVQLILGEAARQGVVV